MTAHRARSGLYLRDWLYRDLSWWEVYRQPILGGLIVAAVLVAAWILNGVRAG